MSALFRYFFGHIGRAIGLAWLALACLFALLEILDELGGADAADALLLALFALPRLAYESLPFAALIGGALALAMLDERRELAVMRTAGLSLVRLACYVCAPALGFMAAHFLIGETLVAAGAQAAKRLELAAESADGQAPDVYVARRNLWLRDGDSYLRAGSVAAGGREIGDLVIYRLRGGGLAAIIAADKARYADGEWTIFNARQIDIADGRRRDSFDERLRWETTLKPKVLAVHTVRPRYLPAHELAEAARHLRENRQNPARMETLLWGKIAATLSIAPLTFVGLCFVAYRRRRVNLGAVGVAALLLGGVYYLLGEIARHLGRFGDAPAAVTALLPLALLTLAAGAFLYRRERR